MPPPEVYPGAPKPPDSPRKKEENISGSLFRFLETTTAHGLPRVVTSRSWFRRIFWLLFFLTAFGYFTYQTTVLFRNFYSYPVAVSIEIVNKQTVDFPAVTVCNMNMLKKSFAGKNDRYKDLVNIDSFAKYEINKKVRDAGVDIVDLKKRRKRSVGSSKPQSKGTVPGMMQQWMTRIIQEQLNPDISTSRKMVLLHRFLELSRSMRQRKLEELKEATIRFDEGRNKTWSRAPEKSESSGQTVPRAEVFMNQPEPDSHIMPVVLKRRRRRVDLGISGDGEGGFTEEKEDAEYDWESWFNEEDLDLPEFDGDAFDMTDKEMEEWMAEEMPEEMLQRIQEDRAVDEEGDWEDFELEDFGFIGKVKDDYQFKQFMKASKTQDYSDLVDVLKPSEEDLDQYGHQASDFIKQCSFDKGNCSHLDFTKVYNPYYGLCYVFNHGTDNTTVRQTSKFGSRYGLRLTLDIEYEEYFGLFSHKAGARLAIHPNDISSFPQDFGVSAAPGMETEIGASLACSMTCLQRELFQTCGCVDKLVTGSTLPRCSVTNSTQEMCRQMVYFMYDNEKLGCDCPASCRDHIYKVYTSASEWPSNPYKYLLASRLVDRDTSYMKSDLMDRIKKNLVRVHVYLDNPTVVSIYEYPSYPWDRLLADVGGLLGLFIGVSACTAVELLEFLVEAAVIGVRSCSRRSKKTKGAASLRVAPNPGIAPHPHGAPVTGKAW